MKPNNADYSVHSIKSNRINQSNCSLWNNLDHLITQFTGKKRATVRNTPGEVLQPWRSSIKYLACGEQVPLLVKYWHCSQGQRERENQRCHLYSCEASAFKEEKPKVDKRCFTMTFKSCKFEKMTYCHCGPPSRCKRYWTVFWKHSIITVY